LDFIHLDSNRFQTSSDQMKGQIATYSATRRRLWSIPAATCKTSTPSNVSTRHGSASSIELPKPSLPLRPDPHVQTSPLDVRTIEWTRPAEADTGLSLLRQLTSAGMSSWPGLPSWELQFHPHERTPVSTPSGPSVDVWHSAREWPTLAEMENGLWLMSTGSSLGSPAFLPSCP
jgi:hypothetical protein